jgi:hypothetical protein
MMYSFLLTKLENAYNSCSFFATKIPNYTHFLDQSQDSNYYMAKSCNTQLPPWIVIQSTMGYPSKRCEANTRMPVVARRRCLRRIMPSKRPDQQQGRYLPARRMGQQHQERRRQRKEDGFSWQI